MLLSSARSHSRQTGPPGYSSYARIKMTDQDFQDKCPFNAWPVTWEDECGR